jgi:uncharacterized protein with von Willebrand factor type A (vWA) domain
MDRTLTNFIRALRNSEVRISTAETLDAFNAVELVGYEDRDFLKRTLSLVLPKTADEKETFENCFDQFFSFEDVHGERQSGARGEGVRAKAKIRKPARRAKAKGAAPAARRNQASAPLPARASRRKRRNPPCWTSQRKKRIWVRGRPRRPTLNSVRC